MKYSVIERIANWLEKNGVSARDFSASHTIETDGYTIYSETEIGVSFSNYNGKRYNFRVNAGEGTKASSNAGKIYGKGVKLFELKYACGWERKMDTAIYFSDTPSKNSLEQLGRWFAVNTQFTPFPKFRTSDFEDDLKDFIYKVEETKTLKVQSEYDSISEFFADKSPASYDSNASIVILAVDTKLPIIKLEKQRVNNRKLYKFIVDITTKQDDKFIIKTTIDSKEKFISLLESTINALREFKQFAKYANDLQRCLEGG